MRSIHQSAVFSTIVAAYCLQSGYVEAQDEGQQLAEVIVTAQKFSENLRDVPISISVLGETQIAQQHLIDFQDITRAVPNLNFSGSGSPGSSQLEVRGISSTTGASTVGIYLDDVSISQRAGFGVYAGQPEPQLLDIQQIEVLRGPQGTLYGASAEGGVVKFRTNPVNLNEFEGTALEEVSDTKHGGANYELSGVLNAPLAPGTAGLRLAAETNYLSGYIDRYSPDTGALLETGINDNRSNAARLSLEVHPRDDLQLTASVFYQRVTFFSTDTIALALGDLSTNARVRDGGDFSMVLPSLTIHYDTGWADFTAVTGDLATKQPFTYDGTAFNSGYLGFALDSSDTRDLQGNLSGDRIAALPSPAIDTQTTKQFTQELRLSSKPYSAGGSPWTWVGGLYYQSTDVRYNDNEYIPGFNDTFTSLYGPGVLDSFFGGPFPENEVFFTNVFFREKQYSAFGDLTYHINSAFRVSGGLRYLSAQQTTTEDVGGFFSGGLPPSDTASKDHATTFKVSATYEMSPAVTSYATISKGFRLGGPNGPVPTSFCGADLAALGYASAPTSYGHDQLVNYEVGVKAEPSTRAQLSVDVFYDTWQKLQQLFTLPTCGYFFSDNVGSARSYGSEFDLTIIPINRLVFSLAAGYTHATLTQSIAGAGIQAGADVEGVPEWSASTSLGYEIPLSGSLTGYVRGNYNYVGLSHGTLNAANPDYIRPSYGLAGASLGGRYHTWDFSLYAKNLFDNESVFQTPGHATVPVGYVLRPRTVGITLMQRF